MEARTQRKPKYQWLVLLGTDHVCTLYTRSMDVRALLLFFFLRKDVPHYLAVGTPLTASMGLDSLRELRDFLPLEDS